MITHSFGASLVVMLCVWHSPVLAQISIAITNLSFSTFPPIVNHESRILIPPTQNSNKRDWYSSLTAELIASNLGSCTKPRDKREAIKEPTNQPTKQTHSHCAKSNFAQVLYRIGEITNSHS